MEAPMISRLSIFTILSLGLFAGCTGGSQDDGTAQATAAVACTTNADCAAGFECEAEPQGHFCKQREPEASGNDHGQGGASGEPNDDHGLGGAAGEPNDDHGQGGAAGEPNEHRDAGAEHHGGDGDGDRDGGDRGSGK